MLPDVKVGGGDPLGGDEWTWRALARRNTMKVASITVLANDERFDFLESDPIYAIEPT